jgi:hypothetical protein
MYENLPRLSFELFREPLDTLAVATINKIDREWPPNVPKHRASHIVVRLLIAASENTYRTIRFICADKPEDESRKLQYALSVPPLARTILDTLFTVVFLFEDLPARTAWYLRAGWREMEEKRARFQNAYGDDPSWANYLRDLGNLISEDRDLGPITDNEAVNPSKIDYWPTPAQMIRKCVSDDRRAFLQHLNDWFYREMSQDAHMSWPGLIRRGAYFLSAKPTDDERAILEKFKSDSFSAALILFLALLSEVELALRLGLGDRAKYLWGILLPYAGDAKEIYELRYQATL